MDAVGITRTIVLTLFLTACATSPPPQVPARLQVCPDPVYAPPPPPVPRTVEALVQWASVIEVAREKTEAARKVCSSRLNDINLWILKHQRG